MKMINGAISGTLIGIGGGGVLALGLNGLLPSLHPAAGDQAVFVAAVMYGVGVFGGIMGALLAGMRDRAPLAYATQGAVSRRDVASRS
jgi:hypothetical protein